MADRFYQPYRHSERPWQVVGGFVLSICIHLILLLLLSQMHLSDVEPSHPIALVEVELVHMATAQELLQEDTGSEQVASKNEIQKEKPIEQEKAATIKQQTPQAKLAKKAAKKKLKPHVVKKIVHSSELLTHSLISTNTTVMKQTVVDHKEPLKQIRQQYLSHIMASIKAHKSYPYSARRRHIEGDIHVSFVLDTLGQMHKLHITGGSSVLRLATQQAIDDALPFPLPPQENIHSQFVMQYRLK